MLESCVIPSSLAAGVRCHGNPVPPYCEGREESAGN